MIATHDLYALSSNNAKLGSASDPIVLRRAAEDFEAVFVSQLLSGMTAGLASDGLLGGGDDPFAAMMRDEYGKLISRAGGLGIADAVLHELLRAQEVK